MQVPLPTRSNETLEACVARLSQAAGFARGGIAALPAAHEAETQRAYLERWIADGRAGEMEYLKRRDADGELLRSSLAAVAPWARSVIVCAAPYDTSGARLSIDPALPGAGWIARYAWSGTREPGGSLRPADYHKVLLRRLKVLEATLHQELGPKLGNFRSWAYVDTGPVVERSWAARAGLGWTGKNTCTLNQELGSFFFLGVILTAIELPEAAVAELAADRCGNCTRCLDACPTNALVAPYQMDASRCISYLTIEKRGPIPEELRAGMGRQVFGCDICQDVCPWNGVARRKGAAPADPEMQPREELVNPALGWLAALSEQEFGELFFGSPVKRARYQGLRRNVAIAMGNSGRSEFAPQLESWAAGDDPVLAETATWALRRLAEVSAEGSEQGAALLA